MASLLSSGKSYTYTENLGPSEPGGNYGDTNNEELTNGITEGENYGVENVGFLSLGIGGETTPGLELTMDLEDVYSLSYVRFFIMSDGGGVVGPYSLTVYGSTDNSNFTELDSFIQGTDWDALTSGHRWSNNLTVSGNYRYIKFHFTAWTPEGGLKNWQFIREVEVYGDPVLSLVGPFPTHLRVA